MNAQSSLKMTHATHVANILVKVNVMLAEFDQAEKSGLITTAMLIRINEVRQAMQSFESFLRVSVREKTLLKQIEEPDDEDDMICPKTGRLSPGGDE